MRASPSSGGSTAPMLFPQLLAEPADSSQALPGTALLWLRSPPTASSPKRGASPNRGLEWGSGWRGARRLILGFI